MESHRPSKTQCESFVPAWHSRQLLTGLFSQRGAVESAPAHALCKRAECLRALTPSNCKIVWYPVSGGFYLATEGAGSVTQKTEEECCLQGKHTRVCAAAEYPYMAVLRNALSADNGPLDRSALRMICIDTLRQTDPSCLARYPPSCETPLHGC